MYHLGGRSLLASEVASTSLHGSLSSTTRAYEPHEESQAPHTLLHDFQFSVYCRSQHLVLLHLSRPSPDKFPTSFCNMGTTTGFLRYYYIRSGGSRYCKYTFERANTFADVIIKKRDYIICKVWKCCTILFKLFQLI